MSFQEIEDVLGVPLPKSARSYQAWWANDPTNSRHSSAWLCAGWESIELDLGSEKVSFRRTGRARSESSRGARKTSSGNTKRQTRRPDQNEIVASPVGSPIRLSLEMQWRTVGPLTATGSDGLMFPIVPAVPGLYRFRLNGQGGVRHYIGETADLRRRFYHYRNPGPTQATNIRINGILSDHLAVGGLVDVDVIVGEVSLLLGDEPSQVDLADKSTRRLLEHAAIVAEGGAEIESLNR